MNSALKYVPGLGPHAFGGWDAKLDSPAIVVHPEESSQPFITYLLHYNSPLK